MYLTVRLSDFFQKQKKLIEISFPIVENNLSNHP